MGELAIDLEERHVRVQDCPFCTQPDDIVVAMVRRDGRACIAYEARLHNRSDRRVEAFVDLALGDLELGELGEFDGPDGYCVVFSCHIASGQATLVDAPTVADEDPGWRSNLRREEAQGHDRLAEWSEALAFILREDPVLRRVSEHGDP